MPSYYIPHTARFIPTTNIFTATFNDPVPGKYSFNVAANLNQVVELLEPGSTYLIDRMSIGGDINEGFFLDAIDELPLLNLRLSKTKEIVYKKPQPVVQYIDDQDIIAWVKTNKSDENLTLDLTGILDQTADLIGIDDIKIFVSLSIYAIESKVFEYYFRDTLSNQTGQQVRGALK